MTPSPRLMECLRNVELFRGLDDESLYRIALRCTILRMNTGHTVFEEGEDGHEMYIVHEGSVRVSIEHNHMSETINVIGSGQVFGEAVFMDGATRSASVITLEPTTLIVFSKEDFNALARLYPRIGYAIMRNVARELAYKLRSSTLLLRGNIRIKALPESHAEVRKEAYALC